MLSPDLLFSAPMHSRAPDGAALGRAGTEALRRGDPARAREAFRQAVAERPGDAGLWLGLAYACRGAQDPGAMGEAADRVLALDAANVRAQILKGDALEALGDTRAASAWYLAALRGAPTPAQQPEDLARELRRAREQAGRHARQYEEHLRSSLAGRGFGPAQADSRFAESLEILFGRRRIYVQQPRYYYFPGLPQRQFYDRAAFPWLDALESATDAIREELQAVLAEAESFAPYVQRSPDRPHHAQQGMLDNPDWSAFYLWRNGVPVADNAARCPRTLAALEAVPLARLPNRSPTVLFSQLRPGAHIPPHHGMVNTRLICHLPVIVPGRCRFRVGNDVREWQAGRAWVFDDTIEHEAWNDSDRTRVVLLFDVERPELDEQERAYVRAMFEAIDAYSGTPPAWDV